MSKKYRSLFAAFRNFGPLFIFYSANHFFEVKAAILVSVAWALAELAYHRAKKLPLSPFFKFLTAITVVFGMIDLYLQQSLFIHYEAALTNFIVGSVFLFSLFGNKPIIRDFAESSGRISKDLSPDNAYYFRFLTGLWSFYSFAKGIFYLWVGSHFTLEQGLAIRGIVGSATFYALLFLSLFGSKQIKFLLMKAKMLPSARPA